MFLPLLVVLAVLLLLAFTFLQRRRHHHRENLNYLEQQRQLVVGRASAQQATLDGIDLLVIMPAYNEAENLPVVLSAAPAEVCGQRIKVVVCDDGSRDGTGEVAIKYGAYLLRSDVNLGGGQALRAGFLLAQQQHIPFVVTLDADGQHRWEDLPAVVAPLVQDGVDVVVGSRLLGSSEGGQWVRALGIHFFNGVLSVLTGRPVTDCSSGYRGIRVKVLEKLRLVQARHHTAELLIEAHHQQLKVVEVPITIVPRLSGQSKKGANWLYGLRFASTIASAWWGSFMPGDSRSRGNHRAGGWEGVPPPEGQN